MQSQHFKLLLLLSLWGMYQCPAVLLWCLHGVSQCLWLSHVQCLRCPWCLRCPTVSYGVCCCLTAVSEVSMVPIWCPTVPYSVCNFYGSYGDCCCPTHFVQCPWCLMVSYSILMCLLLSHCCQCPRCPQCLWCPTVSYGVCCCPMAVSKVSVVPIVSYSALWCLVSVVLCFCTVSEVYGVLQCLMVSYSVLWCPMLSTVSYSVWGVQVPTRMHACTYKQGCQPLLT